MCISPEFGIWNFGFGIGRIMIVTFLNYCPQRVIPLERHISKITISAEDSASRSASPAESSLLECSAMNMQNGRDSAGDGSPEFGFWNFGFGIGRIMIVTFLNFCPRRITPQ